MVEKRRLEEEEQTLLAEKAMAKRKKFKEVCNIWKYVCVWCLVTIDIQALLEKAMKSRKIGNVRTENGEDSENSPVHVHAQSSAAPNFLAPTQAFKVQSMPSRTAKQLVLTDEELVRQEEAKHEH